MHLPTTLTAVTRSLNLKAYICRIYLFRVYLVMLAVADIVGLDHQMIGRSVKNELEMIWNEATVA
jgi:hypothetical protein